MRLVEGKGPTELAHQPHQLGIDGGVHARDKREEGGDGGIDALQALQSVLVTGPNLPQHAQQVSRTVVWGGGGGGGQCRRDTDTAGHIQH